MHGLLTWSIGIVSAPLWDSGTSTFAGLLTTSDYINVIQYYWQHPEAMSKMDQFRLNSLRGLLPRASGAPLLSNVKEILKRLSELHP